VHAALGGVVEHVESYGAADEVAHAGTVPSAATGVTEPFDPNPA
jgi:hypothetical protein